ncbi:treslin isoform X3 [Ambystoma mexicanum]|uniref:treslin isoform X3 n=1 Tax=Ambystoma mexicanum TaxID=8296 RepID=UPI0037E96F05
MASSYTAVLLLDTAPADPQHHLRLRLASLRLLNYLGCRLGPGRVRWGSRCFDSHGPHGRPSRLCRFRELGARDFEDLEEELETRGVREPPRVTRTQAAPPAALTHTALKEILLDYQWDRPDITSPAKPALLRSRVSRRVPSEESIAGHCFSTDRSHNAVFLLSPCPHSRRQLRRFLSGNEAPMDLDVTGPELRDALLPRPLQDMLSSRNVGLYWVDTTEWSKVSDVPDHVGFWTMSEQLQLVGGKILPFETLLHCSQKDVCPRLGAANLSLCEVDSGSSERLLDHSVSDLPFESVLNCLLCSDRNYCASFPQQDGTLSFMAHGMQGQWNCAVVLEPISMNQRYLKYPATITLKGTVKDWNFQRACTFRTDSWVLQNSKEQDSKEIGLFMQLLSRLSSEHLHMVADVSTCGDLSPSTGILSPVSDGVAVLTVISTSKAVGLEQLFMQRPETECSEDITFDLPDIVNSVLSHVYNGDEDGLPISEDAAVPEWVQQELARTNRWSSSVIEGWYPISNLCGASPDLMESFRLLHAVKGNEKEESYRFDLDLTNNLSEFYQKCSSEDSGVAGQGENKRRGVPRTPVRQKMKTMSRSLQMLNVARLNVKAQKGQDENSQPVLEKGTHQLRRRSSNKLEEKAKPLRISIDFKSEKDFIDFINNDYHKTIAEGEVSLSLRVQNMITTIKAYLKSTNAEALEMDCVQMIQSNLFKTGKSIRQQFGSNQDKEAKVRECQIQIFLRLELCKQCLSIQDKTDTLDPIIEDMADMLRILSLAGEPSNLTTFLEEVLDLYISSIPKVLGNLYFSLGTQIPEKLASALPTDFFSDDSMTQENTSPTLNQPPVTTAPSKASASKGDQLEELRTRSAKKRRKNSLARHRSMNEASQNLRQIELPKLPKGQIKSEGSHSYLAVVVEKLKIPLASPPPKKEAVQEVTKVRRNLFNQEIRSPIKRAAKMPRSQSVSALEGVKHKRTLSYDGNKDNLKLLTKKVTETPLHKQVSNRLLHKQIKGRCSDSGSDVAIVEESPEKSVIEANLRRSPRIKQLSISRKHSGSFYSFSQPKSRNLERLHSSQPLRNTGDISLPGLPTVNSPKRLLFGAVLGMDSPPGSKRLRKNQSCSEMSVICQTLNKTLDEHQYPVFGNGILYKSPCSSPTPCRTPQKHANMLLKSPAGHPAEKGLKFLSQMSLCKTERRSDRLAQLTPQKNSFAIENVSSSSKTFDKLQNANETFTVFKSPYKTPRKALHETIQTGILQTGESASKVAELSIQGLCTPSRKTMLTPQKRESKSHLDSSIHDLCTPKRKSMRTPQKPETIASSSDLSVQGLCTPRRKSMRTIQGLDTIPSSAPTKTKAFQSENSPAKVLEINRHVYSTPRKCNNSGLSPKEMVSSLGMPSKNSLLLETLSPRVLLTNLQSLGASMRTTDLIQQRTESPVEMEMQSETSVSSILEINQHGLCNPSKSVFTDSQQLLIVGSNAESKFLQSENSPDNAVEAKMQHPCTSMGKAFRIPHEPVTLLASSTPTKTICSQFENSPVKDWDIKLQDLCTPQKSYKGTPQKSKAILLNCTAGIATKVDTVMDSPACLFTPNKFKVGSPRTPLCLLNSPEVSTGLTLPTSEVALYFTSCNKARMQTESTFDTIQKYPPKLEHCSIEPSSCIQNANLSRQCAEKQDVECEGNDLTLPLKAVNDGAFGNGKNIAIYGSETLQPCQTSVSKTKDGKDLPSSTLLLNLPVTSQITSEVRVVCERLDTSSLTLSSSSESTTTSSQMEESIDISEAKVLSTEEMGLKMKLLVTRKHSSSSALNPIAAVPENQSDLFSTPSYEFRCTPDRRHREVGSRLGTPEFLPNFSTPKSQRKLLKACTPTYEVELEMQASGLPKLKIKRTHSCSTPDIKVTSKKNTTVTHKRIGDESPFSEPNSPWCGRHANKMEAVCVSPSCFRASHNTPGKGGLQTYICQSYTPTRCTANTTSPCHADVGIPWTPSPKHKEKTTDTIKNWPRRKKATAISFAASGKSERIQDCMDPKPIIEEMDIAISGSSSRSVVLGEFEVEGVSQLQDQSPVMEGDVASQECNAIATFGLKSRKRRYECISPDKGTQDLSSIDFEIGRSPLKDQIATEQEVYEPHFGSRSRSSSNKSSVLQSSLGEDEVFGFSGLTPPSKIIRSSLSVSGLMALTNSPLLFQGKTPSSKRKRLQDEEPDLGTSSEKEVVCSRAETDLSPFSGRFPRRSITRTYSRKNLLG